MRCEHCGCDIPEGEETETTRQDVRGGRIGATNINVEVIYLCRACARSSDLFWNTLIWAFAIIGLFGIGLCLIDWIRGGRIF